MSCSATIMSVQMWPLLQHYYSWWSCSHRPTSSVDRKLLLATEIFHLQRQPTPQPAHTKHLRMISHNSCTLNAISVRHILQLSHNAAIPAPPMDCMPAAHIILTKGNPRSLLCLTQKWYQNVTVLSSTCLSPSSLSPKDFFAAIPAVVSVIEFLPGFKLQLNSR